YDRFITGFTVGESNMLFTAFAIACFTFIGYKLLNEIPTLCAALANSVHVGSLTKGSEKAQHNSAPSSGGGGGGQPNIPAAGGAKGSSPTEISTAPFRGKSAV
ncbi:hypothetical protein, partial [Enterobacter hormaechei]